MWYATTPRSLVRYSSRPVTLDEDRWLRQEGSKGIARRWNGSNGYDAALHAFFFPRQGPMILQLPSAFTCTIPQRTLHF